MQFSPEAVRDLARLLNESGLHEIALESKNQDDTSFRVVVRGNLPRQPRMAPPAPPTTETTPPSSSTEEASLSVSSVPVAELDEAESPSTPAAPAAVAVKATAVGLFRQPTPPLQAGDAVKKGQVVGIVESLKIPNEIKAPAAGQVAEIVAEEGQGVEYGQVLLSLNVAESNA